MRLRGLKRRRSLGRRLLLVLLAAAVVGSIPSVAPTATQPPAPTGATGIALDGSVKIAWQPVAGADAYTVYRGTSATSITTRLTTATGITTTSFSDSGTSNGSTYFYAVRSVAGGVESTNSLVVQAKPDSRSCSAGNAVVVENCYPGSTQWNLKKVNAIGSGGIDGYATASSVNRGGSVAIKVNADDGALFRIEIYRTGYYGGAGARLFSTILNVPAVRQPGCLTDSQTGLIDCSNWSTTATITTTPDWPSGVYLLRVVRNDTAADYHILLTVRDDASHSDLLYGVAVNTYEAYNAYGGKSLYDFNSGGSNTVGGSPRAVKVSFDRPYDQVRTDQHDWYTNDDYATVYWLEQMGYDVAYTANTDLETNPGQVAQHRAYISPAHDEYWSSTMRSALQQARDAGTSLFFTGGNEIFWRTRFENSPGSGAAGRVLVCYKTTQAGIADPSGIPTTTWRDPNGANLPENQLTGEMYIGDNDNGYFPLVINATQGQDRIYRYTGLDTQTPGTSTRIGNYLVGWEWDARVNNGYEPAGVKTLSGSPVNGNLLQGTTKILYAAGNATVSMTKYVAPSGALVVATGTNHWNRGLALNGYAVGEPDVRIQQITTNILADMTALPETPPANITLDSPTANRPPAPTGVTATSKGTDQIGISWTPVAGADGYNVYRSDTVRQGGLPLGVRSNGSLLTGTSYTDFGLTSAHTYYYVVTAVVNGTQSLASNEASAATAPSAGQPTRIDAGGTTDYVATTGGLFRADAFFTGGTANTVSNNITGTTDPVLYQSERWGQFTYSIPVVNGTYDVRFHFVELYYGTAVAGGIGKRVFGMDILNTPASPDLSNIDIYKDVGPNAPDIKTVTGVNVTNGTLTIRSVYGAADDPEVAAIEVIPQVIPPTVTSTTPDPGATGVTRLTTPSATFSRAMDASTITSSTFTVKTQGGTPVAGTVAYDSTTNTTTFSPSVPLAYSASYVATLASTVKAADGTPLGTPYTWSFQVADAIPLTSTSNFPANGATGTSPSVAVRATFSRSLDPSTVIAANAQITSSGATIPATVSYDEVGRRIFITPNSPLGLSQTYTATIGTGVTAADGVPLSAPLTWSFTTAATAPPAPTVSGTSPTSGATGVSIAAPVQATFSRSMYAGSLDSQSYTLTGPTGTVAATVTYNDTTLTATLQPAQHLDPSTTYTASIAGSTSAADGTPLGAAATWTFTTVAAPTVTAISPPHGTAYAPRSSVITATFSRAMDPTTLTTSSFTLTGQGGPVAATVSYDSTTNTATLTPAAPLTGGITYVAQLDTSITGADSVPLAAAVTSSFSTAACPCQLFPNSLQPVSTSLPTRDGRAGTGPWSYEFGVKVQVDEPLQVSAIRFYKSPGESGTHVGRIWSADGTQLTSVTFTNETTSGWQQQALTTPITLQPGTQYVISANANVSFVMTLGGLSAPTDAGPLHAIIGPDGVHSDAAGLFPTMSWQSSNYFVDLVAAPAGDPTPPQVSSTSPVGGAIGVARQPTVTATFSRPVDPSTVTTADFTVSGPNGPVAGTVTYDPSTRTASFLPVTTLSYSSKYTAALTGGVHGTDGYPLAAYSWNFTVLDPQPPAVVTLPVAGAADVGPTILPRATFSKSIDATTLTTSTFTIVGPSGSVGGSVAYDEPTKSVTFTPSAQFAPGTYTATLDGSITAMDNSSLGSPYSWNFTVASNLPASVVTTVSPANGATGVLRVPSVTAVFSRTMDPFTLPGAFTLQASDGTVVPSTVTYDGSSKTATLVPNAPVAVNATYTATVSVAAKAADGTALGSAQSWSFSTSACPCSLFSSALTPAASGLPTQDGRFGPGPFTYEFGVKVTVDEAMQITGLRFYKAAGETGTHIGRVWTADGAQLASTTFTNETASGWQQQALSGALTLLPGNTYVISVNANSAFSMTSNGLATPVSVGPLHSVAGANGVHSDAAGAFPTSAWQSSNYFVDLVAVPANQAPPQVSSTSPASGAVSVSRSSTVTATFSRAMDASSLTNSTFTLSGPGGAVPATVTYDPSSNTATLTPSTQLAYSSIYTATVTTGARNLGGVPLAAPVTWSFTVSAPVLPQVTSTVPLNGTSDVGSSVVVRAGFSKSIDPTTLTTSTFTVTGASGAVAGAVTYDDTTHTASFTPASGLAAGSYTARLDGSVTATDQAALTTPFTWTFTVTSGLPPATVTTTSPADGSSGISRDFNISAAFSRSMDPASVNAGTFTLTGGGGAVPATVTYDASTKVATLSPSSLLAAGTTYTANVSVGASAADGTPLGSAASWSFTTAACPCSLFSSALVPAATQLSTQDGRFGGGPFTYEFGVKLTVDQPVQVSALRFYKSVGETGTHIGRIWTATGTQLATTTFTNESASGWQQQALASPFTLQPGATYVISVNANSNFVMSLSGLATAVNVGPLHSVADGANGVHSETAGAFPTESYQSSNYFVDLVGTPSSQSAPLVIATSPTAGATGVLRNASVSATFSRAMDASSFTSSTFTLTGPGGAIPASLSYNAGSNTATLTPSSPLAYSTAYTARLSTGVRAVDGLPLTAATSWSFTVAAPVPPQITSTVPADGASDVGGSVSVRATFSKPIDPATLTTSTFTLTGPSGAVAGAVAYDGPSLTASFTPTAALASGTYTARLDGAVTATDQAALSNPYTWSFTVTAGLPSPQVTATTPADGAARDTTVTATLNRSIAPATLTTQTFHLKASDGTVVDAAIAFDSTSKRLTLTPTSALAGGATYTAEITTGLTTQDGTPFPATTWSFTTGACPCSLFSNVLTPASSGNPVQDGRVGAGPWSYEFGVKFTVDTPVLISAVRFYKDPLETGSHTGRLWSVGTGEGGPLGGVAISTVDFTSETASGWQQQAFPTPIQLQPGIVYMVSVNANAFFGLTVGGLASSVSTGPLHSVADPGNGAYAPVAGQFPTQSYNTSNYFVDLVVR